MKAINLGSEKTAEAEVAHGEKTTWAWRFLRGGIKGGVHPGRLTWNIIMEVWKIIFLSKWVICRFYVNLPGCKLMRFFKFFNHLERLSLDF